MNDAARRERAERTVYECFHALAALQTLSYSDTLVVRRTMTQAIVDALAEAERVAYERAAQIAEGWIEGKLIAKDIRLEAQAQEAS